MIIFNIISDLNKSCTVYSYLFIHTCNENGWLTPHNPTSKKPPKRETIKKAYKNIIAHALLRLK